MELHPECKVSGSLSFILHISRVMGTAPLNFEKVHDGWRIRISKACSFFGTMLIFVLASLATVQHSIGSGQNFIRRIVSLFDTTILGILILSAALTGMNRMRVIIHCVAEIRQINLKLIQFVQPSHKDDRNNRLIVTLSLLLAFITITLDYCAFLFIMSEDVDVLTLSLCIFYRLCSFCLILYVMQFNQIVLHLLPSLQDLNNCLENMLRMLHNDTPHFIATPYSNFLPVNKNIRRNTFVEKTIKHKSHSREILTNIEYPGNNNNPTAATIHQLGLLYCSLTDLLQLLNESNGFPLVIVFTSLLLQLVVQSYNFIAVLCLGAVYYGCVSLLVPFFWVIFHLCKLLLVVEPCHYTHIQREITGHLISELRSYTPPTDVAVISELEIFYGYTILSKLTCYSPLNLFKISRTLSVAMLSSITTYLVVVVQM